MKCAKCGTDAIIRTGKFGRFWCCPNSTPEDNHGTKTIAERLELATIASGTETTDLDLAVQIQMASFGVILNDLDLFIEGDPGNADIDEDPDHWSNMRPY